MRYFWEELDDFLGDLFHVDQGGALVAGVLVFVLAVVLILLA